METNPDDPDPLLDSQVPGTSSSPKADDPEWITIESDTDVDEIPVKKQKTLLNFFGGYKTTANRERKNVKSDSKSAICPHCGNRFGHKGALWMHIDRKHNSVKTHNQQISPQGKCMFKLVSQYLFSMSGTSTGKW